MPRRAETTVHAKPEFTRQMLQELIEMYWERPYLWQVSHENYRNNELKHEGYREMASSMRKYGTTSAPASVKSVKEKIQNLRSALRRQRRKVKRSGGIHSPSLWYYDLLSFVFEQDGAVDTDHSTKDDEIDDNDDVDDVEDDDVDDQGIDEDDTDAKSDGKLEIKIEHVESQNTRVTKRKPSETKESINVSRQLMKRGRKEREYADTEPTVEITYQPSDTIKPAEYDAMGINITSKLKRMDTKQQIYAELLIQKVLAKGLLNQLNEETALVATDRSAGV